MPIPRFRTPPPRKEESFNEIPTLPPLKKRNTYKPAYITCFAAAQVAWNLLASLAGAQASLWPLSVGSAAFFLTRAVLWLDGSKGSAALQKGEENYPKLKVISAIASALLIPFSVKAAILFALVSTICAAATSREIPSTPLRPPSLATI